MDVTSDVICMGTWWHIQPPSSRSRSVQKQLARMSLGTVSSVSLCRRRRLILALPSRTFLGSGEVLRCTGATSKVTYRKCNLAGRGTDSYTHTSLPSRFCVCARASASD